METQWLTVLSEVGQFAALVVVVLRMSAMLDKVVEKLIDDD